MLCSHEPALDPRIAWEAESASRRFRVEVLGIAAAGGGERRGGGVYSVRCLEKMGAGLGWRVLAGGIWSLFGWRERILLVFLAIIALPVWVPAAILLGFAGTMALRFRTRLKSSPVAKIAFVRRTWITIFAWFMHFAPVTAAFWKEIRAMPDKPDVVHCNDLDTLMAGVLARRAYGCRLVYDAHEYYPFGDPDSLAIEDWLFEIYERLLIRHADVVITVNPLLAAVFERAYGLSGVRSLPNAEPWVEARPPAAPDSDASALARGRLRFLVQGRFSRGRGFEELLLAWARVPAAKAVLLLRGPEAEYREELRRLAAQLGVLDRSVHFLPPVTEQQLVAAAAADADVGIIPYKADLDGYKYACPNKLSQYLHAGLMILSNRLPYVEQVLEESGAGICYDVSDADSIVTAVNGILSDLPGLQRRKACALRYARERFNWQAFSSVLDEAYAPALALERSLRNP